MDLYILFFIIFFRHQLFHTSDDDTCQSRHHTLPCHTTSSPIKTNKLSDSHNKPSHLLFLGMFSQPTWLSTCDTCYQTTASKYQPHTARQPSRKTPLSAHSKCLNRIIKLPATSSTLLVFFHLNTVGMRFSTRLNLRINCFAPNQKRKRNIYRTFRFLEKEFGAVASSRHHIYVSLCYYCYKWIRRDIYFLPSLSTWSEAHHLEIVSRKTYKQSTLKHMCVKGEMYAIPHRWYPILWFPYVFNCLK